MVSKTIVFDESSETSVISSFRIVYGIDQNFLFGYGASITPVLLYNNDMSFVFHVSIDNIPEADIQRLSQLAKNYHTCIQIHLVNCEQPKVLPTTGNWLIAVYFHFVITDYFINQQDKVLYLDADIACQGNSKPLITMDFANNVAVVVIERDTNWWSLWGQGLQCNELEKGYFSSGILLVNTLTWAQESVSAKVMSILADKAAVSRLAYMDQDIPNLILLGKVEFIDAKYNMQFNLDYELKKSFVCPVSDGTVLIHYVGPTKP